MYEQQIITSHLKSQDLIRLRHTGKFKIMTCDRHNSCREVTTVNENPTLLILIIESLSAIPISTNDKIKTYTDSLPLTMYYYNNE
jgi:hypothetical protein